MMQARIYIMSLIKKQYSVVLRFRGLYPHQLRRLKMHGDRKGGDLVHIDTERSKQNEILIGSECWIEDLEAAIASASASNLQSAVAARRAKQRPTEAEAMRAKGPLDPWARSKEGPLREGILTVGAKWFGGSGAEKWQPEKVAAFRDLGLDFLRTHFGNTCVHARIDCDEESLHFHFVVATWTTKTSANSGQQRLLQASSNPLFASYEYAQDLAGLHFAKLGLQRGANHAAVRREANAKSLPLPRPPKHVPPTRWRTEQKAVLKRAYIQLLGEKAELMQREAKLRNEFEQLVGTQERLTKTRNQLKAVWEHQKQQHAKLVACKAQIAEDARTFGELWQRFGLAEASALIDLGCKDGPAVRAG
jgi:hypothetical protein